MTNWKSDKWKIWGTIYNHSTLILLARTNNRVQTTNY